MVVDIIVTTWNRKDPFGLKRKCFSSVQIVFLDKPFKLTPLIDGDYRFKQSTEIYVEFNLQDVEQVCYFPTASILEMALWGGAQIPHRRELRKFFGKLLEWPRQRILNPPNSWHSAYFKKSVFSSAVALGVDIPLTEYHIAHGQTLHFPYKAIVKSGLGVNWPVDGCLFQPVVSSKPFQAVGFPKKYPLVFQRWLTPSCEYRVFSTRCPKNILAVQVPTGDEHMPDWRFSTKHSNLSPEIVDSRPFTKMCRKLMDGLDLDYLCLDVIKEEMKYYIVDINPHGTWDFLLGKSRQAADEMFYDLLSATFVNR
jgi:hypothetical protein